MRALLRASVLVALTIGAAAATAVAMQWAATGPDTELPPAIVLDPAVSTSTPPDEPDENPIEVRPEPDLLRDPTTSRPAPTVTTTTAAPPPSPPPPPAPRDADDDGPDGDDDDDPDGDDDDDDDPDDDDGDDD